MHLVRRSSINVSFTGCNSTLDTVQHDTPIPNGYNVALQQVETAAEYTGVPDGQISADDGSITLFHERSGTLIRFGELMFNTTGAESVQITATLEDGASIVATVNKDTSSLSVCKFPFQTN